MCDSGVSIAQVVQWLEILLDSDLLDEAQKGELASALNVIRVSAAMA